MAQFPTLTIAADINAVRRPGTLDILLILSLLAYFGFLSIAITAERSRPCDPLIRGKSILGASAWGSCADLRRR